MSLLQLINMFFLQFFFVRLTRHLRYSEKGSSSKLEGISLMYWIVPFSGWNSHFRFVGERIKYWFLWNKAAMDDIIIQGAFFTSDRYPGVMFIMDKKYKGFSVYDLQMPEAVHEGETLQEAYDNLQEAKKLIADVKIDESDIESVFQFKEGQEVYYYDCSIGVQVTKGASACMRVGVIGKDKRIVNSNRVYYEINGAYIVDRDIFATKEEGLRDLISFTEYHQDKLKPYH